MHDVDRVDHLIFAGPVLEDGIDLIEERTGIRPAPGGRHPNWGTWNASIGLGPSTYLEVIAPDPESNVSAVQRPSVFNHGETFRLNGWIAKCSDIDTASKKALEAGFDLGPVIEGSRSRPDGVTLHWRLTDPMHRNCDGIVPVLIDWGDTPHPASSVPAGCHLQELHLAHPDVEMATAILMAIGIPCQVQEAESPSLRAVIATPAGVTELM
jgi:hypothetical protein